MCPLPDDIAWPSYWIDCSNAYAPSYFTGSELEPPVFACTFHGRGFLWPFMATEACRHCVEEDEDDDAQ